jgi:hypothetical protein
MKITTISAAFRFSKDTGAGWKVIELGAEATLDSEEDWHLAQQGLYSSLTAQLRTLWGRNGVTEHSPAVQPAEEEKTYIPITTQEHFCSVHQTEFRKYEKGGQIWYSHKGPDGAWCRER